jgi:hypothetical protein
MGQIESGQITLTTEATEITEKIRYLVSVCSVFSVVGVKVTHYSSL